MTVYRKIAVKTYKIAWVALIIALATAACLSVYTCGVVSKLKGHADSLPDSLSEGKTPLGIIEAEECFEKHKLLLSFAVSHRELDDIEEALSEVAAAMESRSPAPSAVAYSSALSSLRERLSRLLESERLSLEGIL